jgi:hypothetical protein
MPFPSDESWFTIPSGAKSCMPVGSSCGR